MKIASRSRRAASPILLLLLLSAPGPGCRSVEFPRTAAPAVAADLIFASGTVRTGARNGKATADAVAVRDGRIVAVGSDVEVAPYCGARTRVVDLDGGALVPGLTDAHGHVLGHGLSLSRIDLVGTTSAAAVAARVERAARSAAPGEFILGRGWDQNDWATPEFPTHEILDRAAPRNPVILERVDGHAVWVNSAALERAGIGAATPDPPGGRLLREPETGEPTGILVDTAASLVEREIPPLSAAARSAAIEKSLADLASRGLTCVHDAGVDAATLDVYRRLAAEGKMPIRVYALLADDEKLLGAAFERGPEIGLADGMLTVRSVKLYADGALGSRGAALLEPYTDDPGNVGLLVSPPEHVEDVTERGLRAGFQIAVHAIGDRGNRLVLDAFERAIEKTGARDPRLRVEHAQVVAPSDFARFARLGVIASIQPTHCTSDMYWATDRVGPDRIRGAYAWRSFLEAGCRIAAGSDFPVESPDPLLGLFAARTRRDRNGWPEGGFHPSEALTPEESLAAFTADAAYASFMEGELGSVEVGKRADFTILDRDPVAAADEDLLAARVRMTVVGGRVVYEAAASD